MVVVFIGSNVSLAIFGNPVVFFEIGGHGDGSIIICLLKISMTSPMSFRQILL